MKERTLQKRHQLALYTEKLKGLSPLEKLNQGLSFVSDAAGKAVTDVDKVEIDSELTIHIRNGILKARVTEKEGILR